MAATKFSNPVQSIQRAIEVIDFLASNAHAATLNEISSATGIPSPTAYRILQTLILHSYVRQLNNHQYNLGLRLKELGIAVNDSYSAIARPYLNSLVTELGESVNLAILDRDVATYIAQAQSHNAMRMFTEPGHSVDLSNTGVGKALISTYPAEEVRAIIRRTSLRRLTPYSIVDPNKFLEEIEETRRRGYAFDNEEQEIGVRCVAVLVVHKPTPIALSVSGPANRINDSFRERAIPILKEAAEHIAAAFKVK